MAITIQDVTAGLTAALTLMTALATFLQQIGVKNKYFSAVTTAAAAASKAVNTVAYADGTTVDKAREDYAILVLSKLIPKFDDTKARTDINAVLGVIHDHASELEAAAAAPSVAVAPPDHVAPQPPPIVVPPSTK